MGKRNKTVPSDIEISAAIGEYLKKARKERGYSIKKISEILMQKYSDDVSANMLGKTERGEAKISVRLFLELCDLFMLNFYNF
ncbi:MAG TPA: helix-turn-helix transcriptional regulator, partial [Leptospiraceae bacterium]|nr:helix-turn-helix transcriptional regulator [Leptospiraceae bacterium]